MKRNIHSVRKKLINNKHILYVTYKFTSENVKLSHTKSIFPRSNSKN
jgi:hypothetical protein